VIKQLFLALEKKTSEKKFSFLFIEQIVISFRISHPDLLPAEKSHFSCFLRTQSLTDRFTQPRITYDSQPRQS
jgi:hypothetical protein